MDWCRRNKLILNIKKCGFVVFSRNRYKINSKVYSIMNTPLKEMETVKDLGILLDNKLTFKSHINKVISKASQILGFIIRIGKIFNSTTTLRTLFVSLVIPILEYGKYGTLINITNSIDWKIYNLNSSNLLFSFLVNWGFFY